MTLRYVIRRNLPTPLFSVAANTWSPHHDTATFYTLTDLDPLETAMEKFPEGLSVGVVFENMEICWLPTSLGNWYTIDEGIPLPILEALPLIGQRSKIYRLPEGDFGVLINKKPYPVDSGFYLKTTRQDARLAAYLLGGEVFECLMPY